LNVNLNINKENQDSKICNVCRRWGRKTTGKEEDEGRRLGKGGRKSERD
jgi:hypothetical protein